MVPLSKTSQKTKQISGAKIHYFASPEKFSYLDIFILLKKYIFGNRTEGRLIICMTFSENLISKEFFTRELYELVGS